MYVGGVVMRLQITKSKNAECFYVVKSIYENKKKSNVVVEKLGNLDVVKQKAGAMDPYEWAKEYVADLNKKEKEGKLGDISVNFSPARYIEFGKQVNFCGGYLFLQKIYFQLGLNSISKEISKRHNFNYDINSILSSLIYTRILSPSSKLSSFEESKKYLEKPNFQQHQMYRALDIIATESDFIQSELYKNSLSVMKRNTGILYYDCTNFFFEIEEAKGIRQYGISKEHRPNPIVQLGLFMDADGIPLAFCINDGNTNEQTTLKPLEQKIISDYGKSKFVVCTDAGLSSVTNRKFNNVADRAFVTTQSVKQLKSFIKDWALSPNDWTIDGKNKFNLNEIDEDIYHDTVFFKERWIKENGLEQRLIITYSVKYRNYQQNIRQEQISRAHKLLDKCPQKLDKSKQTDYKRLIEKTSVTTEGEIANKNVYSINEDLIKEESRYDGFYAVCTNLEDDAKTVVKINHKRWEIEECFRIMKSEFKARPVYLSRDNRIKAHFAICFIALTIYRILEKQLHCKYTTEKILSTLKSMNFLYLRGYGYVPTYERSDLTDALHEIYGFRTDNEIVPVDEMKKIISNTKK